MSAVILVIHVMIAVALISLILLQRSEGGALGIGGGGGFMTGRGTANLLTRATAIVAAGFYVTSIVLTLLARQGGPAPSIFTAPQPQSEAPAQGQGGTPPAQAPTQPQAPTGPQPPQSQ